MSASEKTNLTNVQKYNQHIELEEILYRTIDLKFYIQCGILIKFIIK